LFLGLNAPVGSRRPIGRMLARKSDKIKKDLVSLMVSYSQRYLITMVETISGKFKALMNWGL